MQTMRSIRKAVDADFDWIAEKGAKEFNKIYKHKVAEKWLANLLRTCEVYVLEDKSSFISFVNEPEGILVNSWYGKGQGMRLWQYVEKLSEVLKKPMIGFLHKAEIKFKRFLEKRGYMVTDFNEELYYVEGICHL